MSTSVAVPAMLALCRDPNVLGTTFFLMSFVDGKLMLDPNMPGFTASQRKAAYSSMGGALFNQPRATSHEPCQFHCSCCILLSAPDQ